MAEKQDKQILIAKLSFGVALLALATTVFDKLFGFFSSPELTTNAPGTNSAGTNAAADPSMKVPGNTGTVEYIDKAAEGLVMPWHWVIMILCMLVALACILIWRKLHRRREEDLRRPM